MRVEHIKSRVSNGQADGRQCRPAVCSSLQPEGRYHMALARPILILQRALGETHEERANRRCDLQLLTSRDDFAKSRWNRRLLLRYFGELLEGDKGKKESLD